MNSTSFGARDHGLALGASGRAPASCTNLPVFSSTALRGLRDRELRLLGGVEVDDLVGHLAALDDLAVRRLDEAELRDGRHRRERADQADVRAFRRLDRAHAAVVGRVDVAHLDRRALAGQAAGAERRQAAAVGEAVERVRLVHELRQLRRAEELLQRRHDGPDVDDRLRRDRVDVLRRHPLADDALHAVEADPERLLDQLAGRCAGGGCRSARTRRARPRIGSRLSAIASAAKSFESSGTPSVVRQRDELLDEREDVLRSSGRACPPARRRRAAGSACSGRPSSGRSAWVEEQRAQQVAGVVERRRLARALLLEDLDQRLFLARRRVLLERLLR